MYCIFINLPSLIKWFLAFISGTTTTKEFCVKSFCLINRRNPELFIEQTQLDIDVVFDIATVVMIPLQMYDPEG